MPSSSAAQPVSLWPDLPQPVSKHLALSLLNTASVRAGGKWDVFIYYPFVDSYEYMWGQQLRSGTNLVMTLVDAEDPSQYCQAQLKKTSKNVVQYEQALKKYKDGTRFVMSKVGFVEDAKKTYVSCTFKIVVDLSKTLMDP